MNALACKSFFLVCFFYALNCGCVYADSFARGSTAFKLGKDQEAVEYWQKAIQEENDPKAKYAMSIMYRFGLGVQQDFQKRKKLLEESADAGVLEAIRVVAADYRQGRYGFPLDFNKSRDLYIYLAEYGNYEDRNLLSGLYCTNSFEQSYELYIDECYSSLKKSYQHYQSKLMLANALLKGEGVETDLVKAWVWFKLYLEQRPENITPKKPAFLDIERQLTEQQKIKAEKLLVKARLNPKFLLEPKLP